MKNSNSGRPILGDPGAVTGGEEKSWNGGEKIQAKKIKNETFLSQNFFSPA